LKSEISEMQVQLKRAGQDREVQNNEFQKTVAEQRQTKKLLQAALSVLEGFYGKQTFVQRVRSHLQVLKSTKRMKQVEV